ncbi:MAG TPA: leucine-rich repeat domain-containing protein [bacterium]|nr:leucine-rich repeat domain-containing protein [bacterium]
MTLALLVSCENDVAFLDKKLEACIRNNLNDEDDPLTQDNLDQITLLYCGIGANKEESGINSLNGIEHLGNLEKLSLSYSHISDISPLRDLKKLKELGIGTDKKITSYAPILLLPLTNLGVEGAEIEDISFLSYIPSLERINFEHNDITDISVIKQLPSLTSIDISYNKVSSLEAIANHPNIQNFSFISIGYNCMDCALEEEHVAKVEEKNPDVYISCNSSNQLLPENCEE